MNTYNNTFENNLLTNSDISAASRRFSRWSPRSLQPSNGVSTYLHNHSYRCNSIVLKHRGRVGRDNEIVYRTATGRVSPTKIHLTNCCWFENPVCIHPLALHWLTWVYLLSFYVFSWRFDINYSHAKNLRFTLAMGSIVTRFQDKYSSK